MITFLIRRIISGLLVLWIISMLVFALFFAVPNNVARKMAGHNATPETVDLIAERLHLNDPIWVQYKNYMLNALQGDFGTDYYYQIPVTEVIKEALPVTASLAIGAAIIWLVLGVVAGVISAIRPRTIADRSITVAAIIFFSVPSFVLGLTLLYFFYFRLTLAGFEWFPPGGYVPLSEGIGPWVQHLILPWITLAMISAATYSRLTRGSMLETLSEDYIRDGAGQGHLRTPGHLPARPAQCAHPDRHPVRHRPRHAPRRGRHHRAGVQPGGARQGRPSRRSGNQDLPVVMGIVLIASAFVVVANIVVDFVYALLDPRVRLS